MKTAQATPHSGRPSADEALVQQTLALLGMTSPGDQVVQARTARLYLMAVRQGSIRTEDVLRIGVEPEAAVPTLVSLVQRGLLVQRATDVYEATPPNLVLPLMARQLEQQATLLRTTAPELAQVYFGSAQLNSERGLEGLDVMTSMEELDTASAVVVAEARTTLRVLRAPSPRTDFLLDADNQRSHDSAADVDARGLQITSVYDARLLERPQIMEVLAARRRGGEQIKVAPTVPFSVVLADSAAAVVDLTGYATAGVTSLLVRSAPVVEALGAMFDMMWRSASPVFSTRTSVLSAAQVARMRGERSSGHPETPSGPVVMSLDKRDRKILTMLAAGASDATIARQMEVSQRTVERRVRSILDLLGATTRFQAGAQAARRGWI